MNDEPVSASEIVPKPDTPKVPKNGAKAKPMSAAERSALLRVVKGRFKVYRSQMAIREQEIRGLIRERIIEETERARHRAEQRAERLVARYEKLMTEAQEFVDEQAKLGVAPGSFQSHEAFVRTGGTRRDPQYEYVTQTRVQPGDLLPALQGGSWKVNLEKRNQWVPSNIEHRIEEEYRKLAAEKGYADQNVLEREQEVEEDILLTVIETGTAKQWLDTLPTVESLMPLPTAAELKQIEVKVEEE